MRWLGILLIGLAISCLPAWAEDWTTLDGKTYHNVIVVEKQDDGVRITYTGGVGIIPYYELTEDVQKRFGLDHDSLEIKRKAAEAAAEQQKLADEAAAALAKVQPGAATQPGAPGQPSGTPESGTPGQPGDATQSNAQASGGGGATQPGAPGQPGSTTQPGAPGQPGSATPSSPDAQAGGATPSGMPGQPGTATASTAQTPAGSAAQPGATNQPGTPPPGAQPQAGSATSPGAPGQPGVPGAPGHPGGPQAGGHGLAGTLSDGYHPTQVVNPATQMTGGLYPGSKLTYDESQDVCYLDSPPGSVFVVLPEASPAAANPAGTLALRITTDGHVPETPDQIEVTFVPASGAIKPADSQTIKFLVDGNYIPVTDLIAPEPDASGAAPTTLTSISFYLTLEQAHAVFRATNVNFSLGSTNYRIDDIGILAFRNYFADVDHLPPASASFSRSYHKFMARLPSIITMISTVCEYIILISFAIIVAASIAAFVMGMTRFIKM